MNMYDDPAKAPAVQDIILSHLIGLTVAELSKRLGVSAERAFDLFYTSRTCRALHDRRTGLYLQGHLYIADEFMLEHLGE